MSQPESREPHIPETVKVQDGLNERMKRVEGSASWSRFVDYLFIWFLCPFCAVQALSAPLNNDTVFGVCLLGGGWVYLIVKRIRHDPH